MKTVTHGWWLAGAGLAALTYLLTFGTRSPDPRSATGSGSPDAKARDAAPATEAIRALDQLIERRALRAAQSESSWLDLEHVARAYLRRAHLSGSYDDYAGAEAAIREAFRRAPPGAGPFFARAQLSYALHRLDRVPADLARARRTVLRNRVLERAIDELQAALLFQTGAYADAERAFERLLEERRTVTALARMAQFRWKTGDVDRADALFARAEAQVARSDLERRAWLQLMRGLLDLDQDRLVEALEHYQTADALFGGWYLVEEHVAEAEGLLGRKSAALSRYRTLVKKTENPEFMDAWSRLAAELGHFDEAKRMAERARGAYEARLRRFPEASFGHALDHYLGRRDADRAVELAQKNHALRPNAEAATKLARAYHLAGRAEDARRAVRLALSTPWSTPELHRTAHELGVVTPAGSR